LRHCRRKKIRKHFVEFSLIRALIVSGKIQTTLQRAKKLRPSFEKLVTKANKICSIDNVGGNSLAQLRDLISRIRSPELAKTMIDKARLHTMQRAGGYTRILKLPRRRDTDHSDMAQISIIGC
jgi:large subunit ribosomal protein L17